MIGGGAFGVAGDTTCGDGGGGNGGGGLTVIGDAPVYSLEAQI